MVLELDESRHDLASDLGSGVLVFDCKARADNGETKEQQKKNFETRQTSLRAVCRSSAVQPDRGDPVVREAKAENGQVTEGQLA